jgi:hypothetical protein
LKNTKIRLICLCRKNLFNVLFLPDVGQRAGFTLMLLRRPASA